MEINARDGHESTQLEDTIIEELRGNALTADHTPVDPLIAKPIETKAALGTDPHRTDTLDNIMVPEVVIDDTEDNSRPHGSTDANTPGEIDENESLT